MVWLDALDLPVLVAMEASYAIEGAPQVVRNAPDASQTRYRRAGLVPYAGLGAPKAPYPLLRWPWAEVREALLALANDTPAGQPVQLGYVHPETGAECLPTLGFSALLLRPGEELALPRHSASMVFSVVEGEVSVEVNGTLMQAAQADVIAAPTHATVRLANRSSRQPAALFQVDDAPLQRKLQMYERFPG